EDTNSARHLRSLRSERRGGEAHGEYGEAADVAGGRLHLVSNDDADRLMPAWVVKRCHREGLRRRFIRIGSTPGLHPDFASYGRAPWSSKFVRPVGPRPANPDAPCDLSRSLSPFRSLPRRHLHSSRRPRSGSTRPLTFSSCRRTCTSAKSPAWRWMRGDIS